MKCLWLCCERAHLHQVVVLSATKRKTFSARSHFSFVTAQDFLLPPSLSLFSGSEMKVMRLLSFCFLLHSHTRNDSNLIFSSLPYNFLFVLAYFYSLMLIRFKRVCKWFDNGKLCSKITTKKTCVHLKLKMLVILDIPVLLFLLWSFSIKSHILSLYNF